MANHHRFTEKVRDQARGRWDSILETLAPEIQPALAKPGRHMDCPMHGGKRDFRVDKDVAQRGRAICTCGHWSDGFALLMALRGWGFVEARDEVARLLGFEIYDDPQPQNRNTPTRAIPKREPKPKGPSREWLLNLFRQTWDEAVALSEAQAEPARRYLAGRGISSKAWVGLDQALRCHPALDYLDEDGTVVAQLPALIAKLSDSTGASVTLHRIYLSHDGRKADVQAPKKMMPIPHDMTVLGGAIRLGPPARVLGIAEGIETALAVRTATGQTVWAATNATLLEHFEPPEGVGEVWIWADHDTRSQTGFKVARKLQARLWSFGVVSCVMQPPLPVGRAGVTHWDWNDVWTEMGQAGFPDLNAWRRVKHVAPTRDHDANARQVAV